VKHGGYLITLAAVILLVACGSREDRAAKYLFKAEGFYAAGEYVKARLEAQNAVQVEPRNAKARYLLALVAERDEDYKAMFGHLLVAVSSDPKNVEARLKIGTLYFLGQAWDQAAEQATELMKLAPKDPRVHLLRARLLIQKGDSVAGQAEIATALKLDPDFTEAVLLQAAAEGAENLDAGLLTLDTNIARLDAEKARPLRELRALMLSQGNRQTELELALQGLAKDYPQEKSYQFQLAQFYAYQGRVDEADKLLRTLTEIDPSDVEMRLGYFEFLASQKDADKAEATLLAFIENDPESDALRLALGQFLEARGRPDNARSIYLVLAGRNPKGAEGISARNRLAAIEIRRGEFEVGRDIIDKVLVDSPDNANALLYRGALRFTEQQFDGTISDLRLVLRKEPENNKALLLLAQSYIQLGDDGLAKDTYRRLLEVNPRSGDGLRRLAALEANSKNYDEAVLLFRKALAIQSDDVVTSGRLVETLMAQGKLDQAEVEARRLASLSNQSGVGDFSLGRVLAERKQFAAAAESFQKSAAARPDDPLPLEALVRTLTANGRLGEAIAILNQKAGTDQKGLFAKFLLGGIYGTRGDLPKARKYLEEVVTVKPDSVGAWVGLAGTYSSDRNARIRVLERAWQANPDQVDISMPLATDLELAGRIEEAISIYEKVLKANPGFEVAINNLASLLLDPGNNQANVQRALKLAKELATSDNPALLDTLGWAHYRSGNDREAVSVLERVVATAGQFAVFRYHLGMAYFAVGNNVAAKQELTRAVNDAEGEYPGIDEARRTLKKLETTTPAANAPKGAPGPG
jgi:tetratricopeptide (TPR) repeat protein